LKFKQNILAGLAVAILGGVLCAAGQGQTKLAASRTSSAGVDAAPPPASVSPNAVHEAAAARYEGEKRYRANCGRCHMAPHKYPPRMMATIERHMRVRATLTEEDVKYIVRYMTE
jgi:mono/diheme cytochrome c family protein